MPCLTSFLTPKTDLLEHNLLIFRQKRGNHDFLITIFITFAADYDRRY